MQDSPSRPDGGSDRRKPQSGQALSADVIKYIDHRIDAQLKQVIEDAFPGGNLGKHKAEHEESAESSKDRAALWKSVREKIVTGGIWSAVALLATAAAEGVKQWFQR